MISDVKQEIDRLMTSLEQHLSAERSRTDAEDSLRQLEDNIVAKLSAKVEQLTANLKQELTEDAKPKENRWWSWRRAS